MRSLEESPIRRGAVLPIVTICLIGLMGTVALAIDIGLMVVARSQCQNAADIAALAGARTLDGSSSNNVPAATSQANSAAQSNQILNGPITAAQVTNVQAGIYRYNTSVQRFQVVFGQAPATNEAYGAMQVTILSQQATIFAQVLGIQSLTVGAVATAVHRPVDLAVILDYSGSMAYSSQFAYPQTSSWYAVTGSLNPDPNFPRFGPWSIWAGPGMVLDPSNPPATPADLNAYVPPTPMQRVFAFVDWDGQVYAASNLTIPSNNNGPAIVNNFLLSDNSTNAFVASGAFPTFTNVNVAGASASNPSYLVTPAPSTFVTDNAAGFVGDAFPKRYGVTVPTGTAPTPNQYAQVVADVLNISRGNVTSATYSAVWEANGYDATYANSAGTTAGVTATQKTAANRFQGFTMGPGYYGKTFYMWPPDPRTPSGNIGSPGYVAGDWRQRFFMPVSGSGQDMRDNSIFWNSSGQWQPQYTSTAPNYLVNYNNVLAWLTSGPQTLPPTLRSGRVDYYDSIPSTISVDPATGYITGAATAAQCFWKDYIDFVLGAGRYVSANILYGANSSNSNTFAGANLNYNNPSSSGLTPQITARSALVAAAGANPVPSMNYTDNPVHPRAQFWFGPQTMLAYLQLRTYFPGNCYEAPSWQLKVGVQAALADIQMNHPNDMASLIFFSSSVGYNTSRVSMGKAYTTMKNALFYPYPLLNSLSNPATVLSPFTTGGWVSQGNPAGMYDATDTIVPNSGTETCPQMAFMVAYNEFGWSSANGTTYNGRQGAAKVAIFETDGVPNYTYQGSLTYTGGGVGTWYYGNYSTPTTYSTSTQLNVAPKNNAIAVVQQIVAPTTAVIPGFSTTRTPAYVHAIAFGELFEPTCNSPLQPAALRFLAAVQIYGNTSPTPPGSWYNDSLDYQTYYAANAQPYKIITGTYQQRISNLTQAMQIIMQGGIQVTLVQ